MPMSPSPRRATLLWFLVSLFINLLGNGGYALWDRDEPRYAEASRRMLAEGDWVVPKLNDKNRYDKPILIYWLMAPSMALFGTNEFAARAPSAVAGAATVAIVYRLALELGATLLGARVAALASLSMVLMLVIHKAATTDGVLALTVVAMFWMLWRQRAWGFTWGRHIGFSLALAASILVKGPPGPMIAGLACLTLCLWNFEWSAEGGGWWRRLATRLLASLAVVVVIVGPWAWLAHVRTQGEFFGVAIGKHVGTRMVEAMEGHTGPFFYYVLLLPVLVFPWTAPALMALRQAWAMRRQPAWQFLVCWLIPGLLLFSLVKTKLPHYIAPLLPAIALMIGLAWPQLEAVIRRANLLWWRSGVAGFGLIGVTLAAAAVLSWKRFEYQPLLPVACGVGGLLLGWTGWCAFQLWQRSHQRVVWVLGFGFAGLFLLVQLGLLRAAEPRQASPRLIEWIRAHAPEQVSLQAADYREQSLVFYARRQIRMWGNSRGEDALSSLTTRTPIALISTRKRWDDWSREHKMALPQDVSIRHSGIYFWTNKVECEELLVIGNW